MSKIEVNMKDVLIADYEIEKAKVTINADKIYKMKSRMPRVTNLTIYSLPTILTTSTLAMGIASATNGFSNLDELCATSILGILSVSSIAYARRSKIVKNNCEKIETLKQERQDIINSVVLPSVEILNEAEKNKVLEYYL